jgi:hypothetical protein
VKEDVVVDIVHDNNKKDWNEQKCSILLKEKCRTYKRKGNLKIVFK